jgi:hypothetical protein
VTLLKIDNAVKIESFQVGDIAIICRG